MPTRAATVVSTSFIAGHRSQPVAISTSDVTLYSDAWGQAVFSPQVLAACGAVQIQIQATAAGQTVNFMLHTLSPGPPNGSDRRILRPARGEIQD